MDGVAGEKLGLPWKKERGGELSSGSKNRKEGHGWLAAGGGFTKTLERMEGGSCYWERSPVSDSRIV